MARRLVVGHGRRASGGLQRVRAEMRVRWAWRAASRARAAHGRVRGGMPGKRLRGRRARSSRRQSASCRPCSARASVTRAAVIGCHWRRIESAHEDHQGRPRVSAAAACRPHRHLFWEPRRLTLGGGSHASLAASPSSSWRRTTRCPQSGSTATDLQSDSWQASCEGSHMADSGRLLKKARLVVTTVALTATQRTRLDQLAAREGRSRSSQLRLILSRELARYERSRA